MNSSAACIPPTMASADATTQISVRTWRFTSEILQRQLLQRRILRMRADVPAVIRRAAELQLRGAAVGFVGGDSDDRHLVMAVRQGEAIAEGTVRAELDLASANRDRGVGFRGAVDDEFGIHVEPKTFSRR